MRPVLPLFTLLLLAACGNSTPVGPSSTGASAPAAPTSYAGTWTGTTSQNLPITITVTGATVTAVQTRVRVAMAGSSCTSDFRAKAEGQVVGNSLSLPLTSVSGVSYETALEGTFTSPTTLSGQIRSFSASGLLCTGVFVIGTPVAQGDKTFTASKTQ